jgi:hypothetical protein
MCPYNFQIRVHVRPVGCRVKYRRAYDVAERRNNGGASNKIRREVTDYCEVVMLLAFTYRTIPHSKSHRPDSGNPSPPDLAFTVWKDRHRILAAMMRRTPTFAR